MKSHRSQYSFLCLLYAYMEFSLNSPLFQAILFLDAQLGEQYLAVLLWRKVKILLHSVRKHLVFGFSKTYRVLFFSSK